MLSRLAIAFRQRPWTTAVALVLLLPLATAGAFHFYALRQWHLAQQALLKSPAEADARLRTCLKLWPWDVSTHLLAARAARLNADFSRAEALLNYCLKLTPNNRDPIQLEFLLLRVQTGELNEVEEPLLNCVENGHPESLVILETLAGAYMRNLRYAPALNVLNQWIRLEPNSAQPYQQRAWLLERASDQQAALRDYRKAVQLAPNEVAPRLRLAELLLQENETAEAVPHLELLYKRHPERHDVIARLGQCRLLQGRADEARQLLETAVQAMPDDALVLVSLARLDIQEGKASQAEKWLRHLLQLDRSDTEGQYLLVQALRLQGRMQEAEAAQLQYNQLQELLKRVNILLRDVVERHPNDPEPASEAGRGLLRLGQDRLGLYWLHEALRRDARHQASHQALADYYQEKDPEKATYHRQQLAASTKAGISSGR